VEVLGDATVTVARVDGPRPSVRVYRAGSHFHEAAPLRVASR
jgi:hypothetical protein